MRYSEKLDSGIVFRPTQRHKSFFNFLYIEYSDRIFWINYFWSCGR